MKTNEEEEKEPTLPTNLKMENIWMTVGDILSALLLPVFIWNTTKTMRNKGLLRVNTPKAISFFNPLNGYSCANIMNNALWQYGIPSHTQSLQWIIIGKTVGLSCTVLVPSSQYWYADVLMRQWESRLTFIVLSPPVVKNGYVSERYRDKLYKPVGVDAKAKSVDMMIGNLLFGTLLYKADVQFTKEQIKEMGFVPENKKTKKLLTKEEYSGIMPKQQKRRTTKHTTKHTARSVKLGKTGKAYR